MVISYQVSEMLVYIHGKMWINKNQEYDLYDNTPQQCYCKCGLLYQIQVAVIGQCFCISFSERA
jgi:hypothetical protein